MRGDEMAYERWLENGGGWATVDGVYRRYWGAFVALLASALIVVAPGCRNGSEGAESETSEHAHEEAHEHDHDEEHSEHNHAHEHDQDHGEERGEHGEHDHTHEHDDGEEHGENGEHAHAHAHDHGDEEHGEDDHAHEEDDGDHAHGESEEGAAHTHDGEEGAHRPSIRRTIVEAGWELFVEYPVLVADFRSEFRIHLTEVDGHQPAESGTVAVVLTGEEAPGERFETSSPDRPGLFSKRVRPEHSGDRTLLVAFESSGETIRFDVGQVRVYDDPNDVAADAGSEPPGGTSLSKEAQWKLEFETRRVERRKLVDSVRAPGRIRPSSSGSAEVRSPFAGRLVRRGGTFADVGETVEAGELMASVLPTPGVEAVSTLEENVEEARAEKERIERRVSRLESLVDEDAVPPSRLADARTQLEVAESRLSAARGRLGRYREVESAAAEAGGAVALRAPIAGTVVSRSAPAGSIVEQGERVFSIVDDESLWVEIDVPEVALSELDDPRSAWFEVRGSDETFRVDADDGDRRVAYGPAVDSATRSAPLIFALKEPPELLRPGQFVRARVASGSPREVLAVPEGAILEEKGRSVCYVVRDGESFERTVVETGVRDRGWVEIRSGLEPGERVVTRGAYYVKLAGAASEKTGHGHTH